jgi:hypothetical protein
MTHSRYPESQLLGLVQNCRVAFGESPPVFAKATRPLSTSVTNEAAAASVSNYQVNNNNLSEDLKSRSVGEPGFMAERF